MKRVLFALTLASSLATPALADQALAKAKNCMQCHAVDGKQILGPNFKDVAARYANQKDAADKLAVKIVKGGKGAWPSTSVGMPANPQVSEAEAKQLAIWVLSLK